MGTEVNFEKKEFPETKKDKDKEKLSNTLTRDEIRDLTGSPKIEEKNDEGMSVVNDAAKRLRSVTNNIEEYQNLMLKASEMNSTERADLVEEIEALIELNPKIEECIDCAKKLYELSNDNRQYNGFLRSIRGIRQIYPKDLRDHVIEGTINIINNLIKSHE